MIKDIVVNLSVGEGESPTGDYAVSVASALKAHLAGIAFVYDPGTDYYSGDPIVPGIGYIPVEVIDAVRRDNEVAAKVAIDRFAEATSRASISAEPCALTASFARAGAQFGQSRGASISQLSARPCSNQGRAKKRLPKAPCSIPAGR